MWSVIMVRWYLSKGVGRFDGYVQIWDLLSSKIIHHNSKSNLSSVFRFDNRVLFIAEHIPGQRVKTI